MSDRTCSVEGCAKLAATRGWCPMHYVRWKKTGKLGPAGRLERRKPDRGCAVDGCDKSHEAHGWCRSHYARWRATGAPGGLEDRRRSTYKPKRGACAVDGCDKAARTRGWCNTHYERWRRNGDPGAAGDARKSTRSPVCCIEGCNGKRLGRDWCAMHYRRWYVHGDPFVCTREYGTKRHVRPDGYVRVYQPGHPLAHSDGQVAEHRMVMWEQGLLDDTSLHVHHINHDRSDNRPENLEVMTSSEHAQHHIAENGYVVNQYGVWPVRN